MVVNENDAGNQRLDNGVPISLANVGVGGIGPSALPDGRGTHVDSAGVRGGLLRDMIEGSLV